MIAEHRNLETKRHAGVLTLFHQEFVRNGVIDHRLFSWLRDAFTARQMADYEDLYKAKPDDAADALERAKGFVARTAPLVLECQDKTNPNP